MKRRTLLAAPVALAFANQRSLAQVTEAAQPLPEDMTPRYVRIRNVAANEIHVLPRDFALFWTLPDGRAIRYPVGIGRGNLYESGVFHVGAKKEWPSWTPTPEMIEREPHLYERHADGMPGGPNNPLGARAIYLFTPRRGDTFLRIHGTSDPSGLGRRVSNGCVRMANSHVMHLYDLVPIEARVFLHHA
jgi:lipoprotein-anchoring transpeptidase ErfK/SrfK